LAALAFPSGLSVRGRLLTCGAAGLTLFIGLFYLTPMALIQRLAEHSSSGRIAIWRNTLDLIGAYPVVGCGLGGYESAMLRFKTTVLMNNLDYAHNDYLQFLGELGLLGFLIGASLFCALLVRAVRAAGVGSRARWLGVGCAGGLSAVLAHSFFDFNLYVPANAIVVAWIAGISSGLPVKTREDDRLPNEVLSTAESRSTQYR
jgi:O-antigen ligase